MLRRSSSAGSRDARQEVEDLTQQVFVALLENGGERLRRWSGEEGTLPAFVGTIADHEIASILRSQRTNPWAQQPMVEGMLEAKLDLAASSEQEFLSREELVLLWERLKGELSDLGVDLFIWSFVEERSIEEVQELSGMSASAIYQWRSRLARLIRKLREESLSEKAPEMRRSLQRGA